MIDKFCDWLKLNEVGADLPMPGTVDQARQPHLVNAGLGDGSKRNWKDFMNPMRRTSSPTSAFPTYGGEPLPGNKRAMKKH